MKTALFILLPIPSHYYPTFGLARSLQRQGYQITYTGTPDIRPGVEQEGFNFRNLAYVEEFVIRRVKVAIGLFLKSRLNPAYTLSRYREFIIKNRAFEELIKSQKPDITFLDDTLGHYYPTLMGKTIVVQLSTKLSPRRQIGVPPLNCYWLPKNQFVHRLIADWFWFCHIQKRHVKQLIEQVVLNGKQDAYFQARYDRQKGFDWSNLRNENTSFYDGLKNVLSIVLAPSEIEFTWRKPEENEYYIHFRTTRNESKLLSPAYQQFLTKLQELRRQRKTQLVYVSLGTLAAGKDQLAKRFLINVINAFKTLKDIEVVVSTGGIDIGLPTPPTNVLFLNNAPQIHLLPLCDLVITHGGLGTIKECIENGVQMLIYPLNEEVDQPGNSARIIAHQLGLRGRITDSTISILRKINIMLNTSVYKARCQKLQQSLQQIDENRLPNDLLQQLGLLSKDSTESNKTMFHV